MNILPFKVILAEDHLLFREMIKESLQKIPELEIIGEAGNGFELLELIITSASFRPLHRQFFQPQSLDRATPFTS